ncbi:MAG TPA: nucleotidyltransferase family protein [Sphingomicrobium sp.]|nr:nucleotidyltransferase family protein [Sphingomicrobium sp.]
MSWTAVVLAGSRPGVDPLAEAFGAELKPLIPVAGEPMVRRPVRALLAVREIRTVVVVSQRPAQIASVVHDDVRLTVRESRGTIAETLLELCWDRSVEWPVLVTTADHALLDRPMIEQFCGGAASSDIAIGVVERNSILRRFPEAKRTWLKFRGGAYTGANLFALGSPKAAAAIELWRSVEQDRKQGWRFVSLLGPLVLLGTALRLLSIDQVLARLGRRIDLNVKAVRLNNPLAGIDVDKVEDHALVEAILEGRA